MYGHCGGFNQVITDVCSSAVVSNPGAASGSRGFRGFRRNRPKLAETDRNSPKLTEIDRDEIRNHRL